MEFDFHQQIFFFSLSFALLERKREKKNFKREKREKEEEEKKKIAPPVESRFGNQTP